MTNKFIEEKAEKLFDSFCLVGKIGTVHADQIKESIKTSLNEVVEATKEEVLRKDVTNDVWLNVGKTLGYLKGFIKEIREARDKEILEGIDNLMIEDCSTDIDTIEKIKEIINKK